MVTAGSRVHVAEKVLSREMRGGMIILNAATGCYFQPDAAGATIWRLIEKHGSVDAIVQTLAAEHDLPAAHLEPDVLAFIDAAIGRDLLTVGAEARTVPDDADPGDAILQVGRSRLAVARPLDSMRIAFERDDYVRLPDFMTPPVLELLAGSVERGEFVGRSHDGIGTELCLVSGFATAALQLVSNDPALLDAISAIAGCGPLGSFDGRVYRMVPGAGHYDSWHSDVGENRCVALSINLSRQAYEGGVLQLRHASASEPQHEVPNAGFGSAVLFRVSPALRHRVTAVGGTAPRTAYAGWFRSAPDFEELFFASLAKT